MTQTLSDVFAVHPAAQEFLDALATRDFARIERCFAADVAFRALIPPGFREVTGAEAATDELRDWFHDADAFEMQESRVEAMADRLHVTYRIHLHEDVWRTVEQHAFFTIGADGIEALDVLCSGFRPD